MWGSLRRLWAEGNQPLAIAVAVVFALSLLTVTITAVLLISAGKEIASGIIAADQPDALANGWLVVATAFVTGVAPLIALGAAVGRALAGPTTVTYNFIEGESDQGRAPRSPATPLSVTEPAVVSATVVAATAQLFVLLGGTPDVSPEAQAAIVAGLTGLAGLYIRQKILAR
jgi:hypothetical protein